MIPYGHFKIFPGDFCMGVEIMLEKLRNYKDKKKCAWRKACNDLNI